MSSAQLKKEPTQKQKPRHILWGPNPKVKVLLLSFRILLKIAKLNWLEETWGTFGEFDCHLFVGIPDDGKLNLLLVLLKYKAPKTP